MMSLTSNFISESQKDLLKFALSLRVYSAKIAMFHQIASNVMLQLQENCPSFVEIHGKFSCDIDEIMKLVDTADYSITPDLFDVDHHYPGCENSKVSILII